jgi:hypothetical protein
LWTSLPPYAAVTVTTAGLVDEYDTLHELAAAVAGANVHEPVLVPVVELTKVNVTVPAGGEAVPATSVSVTVAVQLLVVPTWFTSGLQLTAVVVVRWATPTFVLPELVSWRAVPPYEAVIA